MNTGICTYIYTHNLFTHFMCKMKTIVVSHPRHWNPCSCLFIILVAPIVQSHSKKSGIPEESLVLNHKWISWTAGSDISEGNSSSNKVKQLFSKRKETGRNDSQARRMTSSFCHTLYIWTATRSFSWPMWKVLN